MTGSLEEAVLKADIIFTCLGDDAAIRDTIATAIKGDVKGKLFVDCSTVHPNTTNQLAKDIQEKGAEMVACPVVCDFAPFFPHFRKFQEYTNCHMAI